jgi:hypothetical protein
LRSSFLYGRTFLGDGDLADQCMRWLAEVANPRVHGTTKAVPQVRFDTVERAALLPLAARPYRSLLLVPEAPPPGKRPVVIPVAVERRALAAYAELAEVL